MKIPVTGFDPSMDNWGIAHAMLDLVTGVLDTPDFRVVSTKKSSLKQVRVNSDDLQRAHDLALVAIPFAQKAKAVFVECPVGSQSARAMAAYGMCIGILGSMRSLGVQLIEVTALESKKALTGKKHATKEEMVAAAVLDYPDANFPRKKNGELLASAEHTADALGAIYAGVQTPVFQTFIKLHQP